MACVRGRLAFGFGVASKQRPYVGADHSHASDRLDASADVISDMMKAGDKGIPQDLMNKSDCVIIVPNMKKAGFIFGAKYGRGFAMCRRAGGRGWSAPAGIRIEGGSFGLQIGGTEQDAVLLVMNETGMKHLTSSKFTLGGDATVAAGPVAFLFPGSRNFCRYRS
jgi:SH3 domain-containing YSC84-like protein 1